MLWQIILYPMTKKDYVLIANAVSTVLERYKGEHDNIALNVCYGVESVVKSLAEELQKENPRFNREIFLNACMLGLPNLAKA